MLKWIIAVSLLLWVAEKEGWVQALLASSSATAASNTQGAIKGLQQVAPAAPISFLRGGGPGRRGRPTLTPFSSGGISVAPSVHNDIVVETGVS